ncbi:hypothetical protein EDD15DRAFT_2364372 [Pisolithus albus]|nr:hypothetical protein EDD15DRAFT_2370509 [Pisolithus albus]KAI5996924.1 hypothetical protein EDD15DRAFT_2364372 [Pisolithus albus]
MARRNLRKGMTMIGPTPGLRVKQLEVRTRKDSGRNRSRLVEVAIKQSNVTSPMRSSPLSTPSKHSRSPSKQHFWSVDDETNVADMAQPPIDPIRLPRTMNDYIREWLRHKEDLLRILLEMEAAPSPRNCTKCGKDGVYRCTDCMHQPLFCTDCCRILHEAHPFHRIQQWTGEFFEDSALHMTGFQLYLGHNGAPCPSASPGPEHGPSEGQRYKMDTRAGGMGMVEEEWEDIDEVPLHLRPPANSKYLTIIDVTGVHFVRVQPCQCLDADSYHRQLFQAKLCASTFEKPSTAFTFAVLDDFLRENLECGTSGMNYYSKLRRVTSNVFPHLVPNRYRELLRLARQWRVLKLLKWNAFQDETERSSPGDLALFCAACPQPGINVDPDVDLDDWKYTRTVVMDGNFKAEHMHEKRPDDQVWLMDGRGFMVAHPPYQEYLQATPHITEKSACHNHRAISQANVSRGKLSATGIGATACARHGCFYPHSVVDFQKGERQLNMDYSLSNALGYNMTGIKNVLCFYDINCSYMKNLRKRVDNSPFLHIPSSLQIVPGIGIWHVHGHKQECYARYAPLFLRGSGWVDGEIIETLWSILNIVSASTRGMSSPHRQELLDFQMNDSNFMKMIRIVDSLSRKLKAARASVAMARDAFTKLDEAVSSENRQAWSIQEESALGGRVRDVSVMDIFEIQLKKAPTVRAVELELLEAPSQRGTRQGAASWITRGLGIEESEITLAITRKDSSKYPSETKRLAMARRSDRLAVDRSRFIADGQIYLAPLHQGTDADDYSAGMTDVAHHMSAVDDVVSGEEDSEGSMDEAADAVPLKMTKIAPLPLPSNFGIERCRAAGADELVEMELKLRIGQANDALHGLRIALADKAVAFRGVVRKATSYSMRTRAWQMVNSIDISVRQQAAIYKRCREAMIALGADTDTLTRFQQLQKSHMAIHTAAFSQNAHDHRSSNLPWFWCMDIPRTTSSKNWLTEFYRIHWLRAKAVKDRWEEEEDLLMSEFHWTMNFFKFRAKKWNKKCLSFKAAGLHGAACYAARQKAVYDRLAEQGASKWLNMSPEIQPLNQ